MTSTATIPVPEGLRLLVVEDEYLVAEYIGMLLEDLGYAVAGPVATIREALAAVADGGLDGALLDANLNGDSSAPVAAALLAAAVPYVVVTGYGARELAEESLNGAPRIVKPFSTTELKSTLTAVFTH